MKRAAATAATGFACVMLAVACGVPSDGTAHPVSVPTVPGRDRTGTASSQGTGVVNVYFVHAGKLVSVRRQARSPLDLEARLSALEAGPSITESGDGLTTAITPTFIEAIEQHGDIAVVSLRQAIEDLAEDTRVQAIAQIVFTLSEDRGVARVRFERGGAPQAVPDGSGRVAATPLTRKDFTALD